jgi:hypothetical protein
VGVGLEIAGRRLRASGLTGTGPGFVAPDEVVRRHGAMQAQEYPLAKWAIGQRAPSLVDEDVDRALSEGSIVRTHVLRPTWHFVAPDDLRWLLALTGPRVQRTAQRRLRQLGLDGRTLARCEAAIGSALEGGSRLTRNELGDVLDRAKVDRSGQRLPWVIIHCELEAIICSGGLSGKQHTYALVDERVPNDRSFDRDDALAELVRRYLAGHGPATVQDLRWWSSLTVADVKEALGILGSEAISEDIDGITFWSLAASERDPVPDPGVQLLHAFDELIVGYTLSRFFGDPRAELARAAWTDRTLPTGLVLHDGEIAGLWKRSVKKDSVTLQALLYGGVRRRFTQALEAAGEELGRFLALRPMVETSVLGD